jgi:hypothetical protein
MAPRLAALLVAVSSAVPAKAGQRRKPITVASAFTLPSTKACMRGATLTIGVRKPRRVTWGTVTVAVNGRRVANLKRPNIKRSIRLTGLPNGTLRLTITARATDGRRVTAAGTYRSCVPVVTPAPRPTTPTPTSRPEPTPTATPIATPTVVPPGSTHGGQLLGTGTAALVVRPLVLCLAGRDPRAGRDGHDLSDLRAEQVAPE